MSTELLTLFYLGLALLFGEIKRTIDIFTINQAFKCFNLVLKYFCVDFVLPVEITYESV